MRKQWREPEVEELNINMTENGQDTSEEFDGDWVEIDGKWYRPGSTVLAS